MVTYASQRVQFGRPIVEFEITQRKIARLASDIYAADAMLGILASLVDRARSDFSLEAACCKVFASDMIWSATDELVQVAGGRGYVQPYPYERMLRDARINRIFEGTNEVLRLFIALNGIQGPAERLKEVGSALRNPIRSWGLISGYATSRVRSAFGATPTLDVELHERLQGHKRYFEKHVAELSAATDRMIRKHRKEIIERQQVLERLADMAIELFATASVLAWTQRLIDQRGELGTIRELRLCDLFCIESGLRFRRARLRLEAREDETRREVAAEVRQAGYYFVADSILDDR
jgi:acyl-CoA dehydrogenase family protein 9